MAPQGKIRTLSDLDQNSPASSSDGHALNDSTNSSYNKSHKRDVKLAHIPNLPDAHRAKALLERIYKEFVPILQKRGYAVGSVSEMCCCGDGVDHHIRSKGKKKKRIMASNVLGYNQTVIHHGKTHSIHLRLRHSQNHAVLFSYEEVAGTMSHELAHCEVGPHNAKFYKLMDEIQEQHAVFMAKGIVADNQGFPINSDQAHVLGGGGGNNNHGLVVSQRDAAARAAQQRLQKQRFMPQGPQRLGGTSDFTKWLQPGQAAGMAAETRRLQDEVWCQPCEPEIIEVSDDSEDDDEEEAAGAAATGNDDRKPHAQETIDLEDDNDKKLPAVSLDDRQGDKSPSVSIGNATSERNDKDNKPAAIDLTGDDEEEENDEIGSRHRPPKQRRTNNDGWSCTKCTFVNTPLALACTMCGAQVRQDVESMLVAQQLEKEEGTQQEAESMRVAKQIYREQTIEQVKEQEVAQSERDFGFNVYGDGKRRTATMKHLT